MQIKTIETGLFKLDGGAMFGVVPRKLWTRNIKADENNLCEWSMRCLFIENGDRRILIDTGIGNKQDDRFFKHYFLSDPDGLNTGLNANGISADDITDVFLTHLHFDHCGGAIKRNESNNAYVPTFKNATYWSCEEHWNWATEPNPREKASFLKENILPIQESGQLQFVKRNGLYTTDVFPDFDVMFVDGHTESQMIPHINYKGKKLVFAADLLPSHQHIPLPWVMAYDTRPLLTMKEKEVFLQKAVQEEYILLFEHDAVIECATLKQSAKGIVLDQTFNFNEI